MTTGMDLRIIRVRRRITVAQVARAARVSRTRISTIEAQACPTDAAIQRYLEALDQAGQHSARNAAVLAAG